MASGSEPCFQGQKGLRELVLLEKLPRDICGHRQPSVHSSGWNEAEREGLSGTQGSRSQKTNLPRNPKGRSYELGLYGSWVPVP